MKGLKPNRVALARYSRAWPRAYSDERARIRRALGAHALDIQHIGSTAVPDVPAKPIIDVAVRVNDLRHRRAIVAALTRLGYEYQGEYGLKGRHFFTRGDPVTHHIHVVGPRHSLWMQWLAFRELLRADSQLRREYVALKLALAREYAADRASYTAGKSPFIQSALSKRRIR